MPSTAGDESEGKPLRFAAYDRDGGSILNMQYIGWKERYTGCGPVLDGRAIKKGYRQENWLNLR
jgi:hypothetical protein